MLEYGLGSSLFFRACTNSASWIEDTLSLDTTPTSILNFLRDASWVASEPDSDSSHHSLKLCLDSEADMLRKREIMKFLRNGILLCTNSFPRNYILEEALLLAEELSMTQANSSISSDTPSRPLAKRLLKNDRQVSIIISSRVKISCVFFFTRRCSCHFLLSPDYSYN